jgi:Zn-dependent peptidase ImmA (M78 family)
MVAFTITVNPSMMKWAREEAGYSIDDAAMHLKTPTEIIAQWETDGLEVKYTSLNKLAKFYKRQVAVFFLQQIPKKVKKPNDYRNLSKSDKAVSAPVMLAIRRTSRYLETYREFTDQVYIESQYEWLNEFKNGEAPSSERLRKLLDITEDEQKLKKNQKFSFWRKRVEDKLGIFVFQFPIPNREFDGFSYVEDGKPYAITINSQVAEKRKVFTIFHELGHIISGDSGICFTTETGAPFSIEAKCNRLAAEFLMPQKLVEVVDTFEELADVAESLGVSKHAYLIRLKELRMISDLDYRKYMSLVRELNNKISAVSSPKEGFAIPPAVLSKSYRGDKFFDFVVTNYDNQKFSPTVVRDLLDMRVVGLSRSKK